MKEKLLSSLSRGDITLCRSDCRVTSFDVLDEEDYSTGMEMNDTEGETSLEVILFFSPAFHGRLESQCVVVVNEVGSVSKKVSSASEAKRNRWSIPHELIEFERVCVFPLLHRHVEAVPLHRRSSCTVYLLLAYTLRSYARWCSQYVSAAPV